MSYFSIVVDGKKLNNYLEIMIVKRDALFNDKFNISSPLCGILPIFKIAQYHAGLTKLCCPTPAHSVRIHV